MNTYPQVRIPFIILFVIWLVLKIIYYRRDVREENQRKRETSKLHQDIRDLINEIKRILPKSG